MRDDAIAMNDDNGQELRVDLVFDGQVLAGFDPAQVQRAIAERFKLDDQRRERMFSGVPYVVKRAMAPADATRYIDLFATLGARLRPQGGAARSDGKMPTPVAGPERGGPAAAARRPASPTGPATGASGSSPGTPSAAARPASPKTGAASAPGLALLPADAAPAPRPEPAARPHEHERAQTREQDSALPVAPLIVMDAPPRVFGFGLSGRLARRPYGAGALFGWAAMRWGLTGILHHPRPAMVLLIGLGMLVAALWTFRLTVLRLHDVGLSGWWVLVGAVPLVGTLAGLLLGMVPGSQGDNRFGAEPDPGSPVLRMVVAVAVACIGAGFRHGLWVDNGVGAPRAASALSAPAADDAPRAPTDDELSAFLKSPKAHLDFREAYWPAANHKAFASSDGGASGWAAGLGSRDAARTQALAECEKTRDAYSAECQVVSVDGDWAD